MCEWGLNSARLCWTGERQEVLVLSSSCLSYSFLSESQGVNACEWASFLCQPKLSSEDKLAGISCCSEVGQDNSLFSFFFCSAAKLDIVRGSGWPPYPTLVLGKIPASTQATLEVPRPSETLLCFWHFLSGSIAVLIKYWHFLLSS